LHLYYLQIVDVIGELMKANADHAIVAVVDLVTQMLDSESGSRKNAKKDSNKKTKLFNVCQDICSCIVEKIMDYDQEVKIFFSNKINIDTGLRDISY
jgi:hypothetical protein